MKIGSKYIIMGLILLLAQYSIAQSHLFITPNLTILANSIDMGLSAGYIETFKVLGFNVTLIPASEMPNHQTDSFIIILGGQNSPDGIGPIVNAILSQKEKEAVLANPLAKTVTLIPSLWTEKQMVIVFAGYGKEQTRKAFGEAQGDLIKTLRFNDNGYLDNFINTEPVIVPPIDISQPFTEINAYQADNLIRQTQNLGIIDVRGVPFYDAGHISKAVNIPERKLEQSFNSLETEKTYLLYCGGNSESIIAGNFLSQQGFKKIYRLVDGYVAWRKAGFPREQTSSH
jgi:rhodanese-related sulfurtransferase